MAQAQMTEVFAKFEEIRGSVTPELLEGIFKQTGRDAPAREDLEKFIEEVYSERELAKKVRADRPEVRGVTVGEGAHDYAKARRNYENINFPNRFPDSEKTSHQTETTTMWELLVATAKKYPDNVLYRTSPESGKPYETYLTYAEAHNRAKMIGNGLREIGIKPKQFVGIMLDTCPAWGLLEFSFYSQSIVPVTLYSTYGADAMEYIINHAELEVVVVSKKCFSLLCSLKGKCPSLKKIIYIGDDEPPKVEPNDSLEIHRLETILKTGACSNRAPFPPSPEDLSLVIYTSGTTGNPKGVPHTHAGFISMLVGNLPILPFTSKDSHLAFLPMAHIMEQFIEGLIVSVGASIDFWTGDVRVLLADVATSKPSIFIGVPRVLNRLYGALRNSFDQLEGVQKVIFEKAFESKRKWLELGCYKSFYDLFVFSKASEAIGGRVRLIATGSAPIDPAMLEFFRIVFSCPVLEGFGMTEVLITNLTTVWDTETRSHVGPPNSSVEIKLVDLPQLNYLTTNNPPRGEVCFRGPMTMKGYYKDPEKTQEAIDEEGWFHSGDVGEWGPDGHLRIVDRVKHIFKLQQGEYVAPEKLEQLFVNSKYVSQIYIDGSSLHSFLVAIVVPDPVVVEASLKKYSHDSVAKLFEDPRFKQEILDDLSAVGRAGGALGFEIPRAIGFSEGFESFNLLTPTFKMKRTEARIHFKELSDALVRSVGDI